MTTQPNYSEQAEVSRKLFAYHIYIPAEQRGEFVYDLEEALDDLTNCECVVTELFAGTAAAAPNYTQQSEVLRQAWSSDEARRNAAIGLWVAEAGDGYPVARPVSADEFKGEA